MSVLRADAQEMAHSLLQMPWHPESYLLGASRGSMGICLLTGVSHRVVPVAHRISSGIDRLGLGEQERKKLQQVSEPRYVG